MSLDSSMVIIPGEGHYYIAPSGTAAPTGTGVPSSPWTEVGHTSHDSPLTISRDGGDRTTLPSWQSTALRESVATTTYALGFGLLQHDELANQLYYGGGKINTTSGIFEVPVQPVAQEHALFVRIIDGNAVWARHFSKTSILGSDSEEADPEALMSMPVQATILSNDDLSYLFGIYLPPSKPIIASIAPTSGDAAGGDSVVITGSRFAGTTAVKFGDTDATDFNVDSDSQITATTPAGTAGTADVVVTNATGTTTLADGFTYA